MHCSGVFIVDFEQVNTDCVYFRVTQTVSTSRMPRGKKSDVKSFISDDTLNSTNKGVR